MSYQVHSLKLQCYILSVAIAASEIKQYDAPWLKNVGKVMRDAAGRFASKGVSAVNTALDTAEQSIVEMPNTLDSAVDAAESNLLAAINIGLEKALAKDPRLVDKIADCIFGKSAQELREQLAARYEKLNPTLSNEIKKDPFEEIRADLDNLINRDNKIKTANILVREIGRAFQWVKRKYQQTIEGLKNLKGTPAIQAIGRAAAAAIPIAVSLVIPGVNVGIGLLLGDSLMTALVSTGAGYLASVATHNMLDAANIENPWIEFGVSIAAAIALGSTVNSGLKLIEYLKQFNKLGEQEVKVAAQLLKGAEKIEDEARAAGQKYLESANAGRTTGSDSLDFKMPTRSELEAQGLKIGSKGAMGAVYFDKAKGIAYKFGDAKHVSPTEIEIAAIAGEKGFGPKFFGSNEEGYAMELLQDHNRLDDLMANPRISRETVQEMTESVLAQIEKMHKQLILHQDLHGGNVMISPTGEVKIIDYGLAHKISLMPDQLSQLESRNEALLDALVEECARLIRKDMSGVSKEILFPFYRARLGKSIESYLKMHKLGNPNGNLVQRNAYNRFKETAIRAMWDKLIHDLTVGVMEQEMRQALVNPAKTQEIIQDAYKVVRARANSMLSEGYQDELEGYIFDTLGKFLKF